MSKILITGDIHIWNYADHNLETDFRLNQFKSLASRLVEIGNQHNCEYIILAGDITHKAIIPPKVEHTIKAFFDTLNTKWGKNHLLYILGNHDKLEKQAETVFEQSSIPVIADNKATYAHKQIFNINGREVALMDWLPKQDLSWIKDKVDLFVGHVTLDNMFGQEFDSSKFKLGIAGDIHHIVNVENMHSTNVPIPHYISDEQNGSVVIYDTDTGEFERVKTESETFKHLKIYYEDAKVDWDNPYIVKVKKPTKVISVDTIYRGIDIDSIIEKTVQGENLTDVHKNYISALNNLDSKPIDLNFEIRRIRLKNFLSISSLDMQLPNGLITLSGANGKGKSSLIRAIDFVFRPPRSVKDFIKLGEKELELEIIFDYKGKTHRIERTYGSQTLVTYSIDGAEQLGSSVAEVNKQIEENLDFLQLFDILYRYQSAPYLLSGFNYSQRIDLVSKLLGLGKIEQANALILKDLKELGSQLKDQEREISNKQAVIDELGQVDISILAEKDNVLAQLDDLNKRIEKANTDLNQGIEYNAKANANNAKHSELEAKKDYLKSRLISDTELQQLNDEVQSLTNKVEEGSKYVDKFNASIDEFSAKLSELELEKGKLELEINAKQQELNKINLSSKVCSACGREFDNAEDIQKHYDQVLFELNTLKSDNQIKINELDKQIQEYKLLKGSKLADKQMADSMISKFKAEIYEKETRLKNQQSTKDQLNELENVSIIIMPLQDISSFVTESNRLKEEIYPYITKKAQIEQAELNLDRLNQQKEQIDQLNSKYEQLKANYLELEKYTKLFHPTGAIVRSVFLTVAELLTEDKFVVRTVKTLKSGETKIDFDVDYKVGNLLIPYQNLSGGQKVIVDIFFLAKLFKMSGQVGLLMLDETLKDLDVDNLERAVRILREAPISTILLVTHVESFNFYDLKYNVDYIDGCSIYKLEGN